MAKYDQVRGESIKHHIIDRVQAHNNEAKKVRLSHEGPQESYMLKGKVDSDFMDWLTRSLVCTSEEPRDLGALASALIGAFRKCTKICSLSSFKFIPTFPTHDRMEEVLSNHKELYLWFVSVKKWDKYDYCETRRVRIEIFRVPPPHGWTWDNFKKVTVFEEELVVWANLLQEPTPLIQ
ncbi:hypothetical protein Cgig2_011661 [Carnegiea gigantea]|uniref:Uncharacterized protein n=1 Tax=Carnegiea gigantea TaxID=171969 RepID=A0A9Q1GPY9_9CARY|nr:hypothetical protein Cgig2_011661 [Carnegiea gigantea]